MGRLAKATANSVRALDHLLRREAAFRLEGVVLVVAVPVAYVVAKSWGGFALLIAALLLLMVVEVLNTSIEAACNAISRETNADIRLSKDCGSLAVAIAMVIAAGVWIAALVARLGENPW